ncbi:PP2C-domain-containing protein [Irpex rosettiformis]|uniref:PP2C-domain-containing protein n=1 Tax=Irpex rosettiformis TaxID=378272 RepID=A0ACB8TWV3_9APHY|nr:PP2C-domain-containing protein [Irpex rosettiformis]
MGQTLSSPATDKDTKYGLNEKFLYALTGMQGWRISMEDSHTAILKLDESKPDLETDAFFGVFDGHGGANVAKYAGQYLWKRLVSDKLYKKGEYAAALKSSFLGCDADMKSHPEFARDSSGCTAVTTLITRDNRLFCANAGDSRAIICTKGVAKDLSIDHKPKLESERKRIISAGGFVEYGRVNGNLALSRAFGDFEYKKNKSLPAEDQIITCNPEIIEHLITEEDEFVLIACDGIWDCLNSQQAADFVRAQVAQGKDLAKIAEDMCDHCLAPSVGGGEGIGADNMTVLIVALLHGRSPKDWVAWVKDRVESGYGYKTPSEPARIWPESQVQEGKRKRELYRQRETAYMHSRAANSDANRGEDDTLRRLYGISPPTWDLSAHILGSNGGITYRPGSSAIADLHNLMFDSDGDDDLDADIEGGRPVQLIDDEQMEVSSDDSDEVMKDGEDGWRHEDDGYPSSGLNATRGLREQLEELEKEDDHSLASEKKTSTSSKAEGPSIQGEAPLPPKSPAYVDRDAPAQLVHTPGGDAPSDAVKQEGFLDASESPLKT